MAAVTLNLDRDVEARVSRYADGIGVPLEDVIERALIYALTSRYPDNELPDAPGRPDQGLPGEQPEIDNSLPPFDGSIDNELPEGEVPVDPDYGVEEGEGGRPDNVLPDVNPNPNLNPDVDKDAPRPGQGLPPSAQPKG